jgi:hypothetical protein
MLDDIDSVVGNGKAVITAGDKEVLEIVKEVILRDASASFYLTEAQAAEVNDWYWTPERVELTGIKLISKEEDDRIRAELGIINLKNFRYAPLTCECGHEYGAFDFLKQGVEQHGLDAVNAVFALENSTFFQVNPNLVPVCPDCNRTLLRAGGGWYNCDGYGGCCCCADQVFGQRPLEANVK